MKKQLHVISTGQQTPEELVGIVEKLHQDIDGIHLREKKWSASKLVEVIQLFHEKGVPLTKIFINDRIDVALAMRTGGVHLANHSINITFIREMFPTLKIGCSVHSIEEAVRAEKDGADYLFYGHIFETLSKKGVPARGLSELERMKELTTIPIIAIGGITPDNTIKVMKQSVAGIAVMSGILLHDNPVEATKKYRYQLDKELNHEQTL